MLILKRNQVSVYGIWSLTPTFFGKVLLINGVSPLIKVGAKCQFEYLHVVEFKFFLELQFLLNMVFY